MDPFSALANGIAIFEGLKKFYRFANDAKKAPVERLEFHARFDSVHIALQNTIETLVNCLAKVKDRENTLWIKTLKHPHSPLRGLEKLVEKVNKELEAKKGDIEKLWNNLKWHSEKKHLEEDFNAIGNFCRDIRAILDNAVLENSYDNMKETTDVKDMIRKLKNDLDEDRTQKRTKEIQLERKLIESWLSNLDFQAIQKDMFEQAVNTGSWFLNLPSFKIWKDGRLKVLQCYGKMGTGKTILSSILFNHLAKTMPSIPTLILYLEETPKNSHDPENLLGSLVKQLIQMRGPFLPVPDAVHKAWSAATQFNARPSLGELEDLFKCQTQETERVQIIINGFDRATQETRIYIKSRLRQLDPEHIRLLILARRDVESTDKQIICDVEICDNEGLEVYYRCKNCPKTNRIDICEDCHNKGEACPMDNKHKFELPSKLEVFIVTPDVDLARYIRTKIEEKMPLNNEDIDSDLESDVAEAELLGLLCAEDSSFMENTIQSIVENSRGRFLLAKLYTKSLMNKFTASQIKEAIDEMNDSKYEIAELIDHLLEKDLKRRLATLPDEQQKFAKKIFSIIYYAKRDLSFRELQHALAVSPGMRVYSEYSEAAKNQILRMTKGFVTIRQDTTQIVRFDDGVLNNYFDKTRNEWFPTGEVEMAKICLDYLSLDAFSKPCEIGEFVEKEKSHSFLAYAVENWGHHARLAGNEEVGIATARFLHDHERIQAYIQAAWETNVHKGQKWDVRKRIHALHIFAWFDLWKFISLLDVPLDLNATEGTYGQTPLIYACKRGNIETARHLLLLGASVNMTSTKGRTALHEAIYRKDIAIVELLLSSWHSQDLDVNTRNAKHANRTPLMIAILEGCDKIALSLISHPDIIVTIRDKYGFTALSLASWENRQCIVDALLVSRFSRQIEVDAREIEGGRSALILAAERNHDEIMRALLNAGADPNLRDLRNGTAIFRAVEGRAIEAFKLLVEYKADLQLKDERSRSLMHCAAEQTNQTEIILLLKSCSLDIDAQDDSLMTPLHRACVFGRLEAAETLGKFGANFGSLDSFLRTPFVVAYQYGQEALMTFCRESAPECLADPIESFQLPIWSLVRSGRVDLIAEAKSRREAEFSCREPGTDKTNFHTAILNNNDEAASVILKMLLNSSARDLLDATDFHRQTPLHLAAIRGYTECLECLVRHGAKLDEVDRFGKTALYSAFANSFYKMAVCLIDAGTTISNDCGVDLQKILFAAIEFESIDAVRKLLDAGADVLGQDEYGVTPKELARQTGNQEVIQLILTSRSAYFRDGSSRTATRTHVTEPLTDEPTVISTNMRAIPFHPFRGRFVDLDWSVVQGIEPEDETQEPLPVLC